MTVQDVPKTEIAAQLEKLVIVGESDELIARAKQIVVENYNTFHDATKTPALTTSQVSVLWFTQDRNGWRAILTSPLVRGLLYELAHNNRRGETHVEVYKKINQVKVGD